MLARKTRTRWDQTIVKKRIGAQLVRTESIQTKTARQPVKPVQKDTPRGNPAVRRRAHTMGVQRKVIVNCIAGAAPTTSAVADVL